MSVVVTLSLAGPESALGFRATPQNPLDTLLAEVLEKSGAKAQIEKTKDVIVGQISATDETPEELEQIKAIYAAAYSGDLLYASVVGYLTKNGDAARLQAVLEWWSTPVGQKMAQTELEALAPEAEAGLQAYAQRIQRIPPTDRFVSLIQRLESATGALEKHIAVQLTIARSLVEGGQFQLPPDKRMSPEARQKLLDALAAQMREGQKQQGLTILMFIYRRAPSKDLEEYVKFLESDTGKWFTEVGHRAYLEAMTAASKRTIDGLASYYRRKPRS